MKPWNLEKNESKLDAKDWILLEALQADARLPFAELGRRAGLSPPAAAERVRRMEDAGLITGYHASLDPKRLGLALQVLIEVQVKRQDYTRFERAVREVDWILECHHVTGRTSFLLKASAPSVDGLERLIGHLSQFGDTSTSVVLSTVLPRRTFQQQFRH